MKQTLILDSSQISLFHECPQKWEYESVEQLTQVGPSERDSLSMGTFGHKLMEIYYKAIALGKTTSQAYTETLNYEPSADSNLSSARIESVRSRFLLYTLKFIAGGRDIKPSCKEKYKVLIDEMTELPIDSIEKVPMVEMGFAYKLLDTPEYLFVLEGMIDLIGMLDSIPAFMDHKWQDRRKKLHKKSVQFKNYSMVTNSYIGIINYVRMAEKVDNDTFARDIISFTPQSIKYWKQEVTEIFIDCSKEIKRGYRTKRWGSCGGKFGYPCEFTDLCETFEPNLRQTKKEIGFKKKEKWEPWKLATQLS